MSSRPTTGTKNIDACVFSTRNLSGGTGGTEGEADAYHSEGGRGLSAKVSIYLSIYLSIHLSARVRMLYVGRLLASAARRICCRSFLRRICSRHALSDPPSCALPYDNGRWTAATTVFSRRESVGAFVAVRSPPEATHGTALALASMSSTR